MLSSISPVGETARHQRWAVTVTAYLLGSTAAAAAVGAALGGVGLLALAPWTSASGRLAALGALAVLGVVLDATVGVPGVHRQVDERWLTRYRGWVYGLGFGAQLGVGVATIVPASVVWAVWVAALLTASPAAGAVVGTTFGLLRALPLLLGRRAETVGALRRMLATMHRARRPAAWVTLAGQVGTGGLALATALRWHPWA